MGTLAGRKVFHLTTVDMSLEYLLMAQLLGAQEAGAEVSGISAPGPSVPRLEAAGIRHIPLVGSTRGMSLRGDLRAAIELWRILRRHRPDILHTHNPKPGVYGRIVGRLAGVPVVVNTVHGLYATEDDRLAKRAIVYGLEALASRFSHAELVQNEEDLALMLRWHLVPRHRAALLGNGVDLQRFDPGAVAPALRENIRRELGLAENDVVVGMVGRLVVEKGYAQLVEAAEALGSTVRIIAIGGREPDKPDALDASLMARGVDAGIRFLGHRDNVRDLYAAMDIVVLASFREGLPRALMEAAAMAKPLVASDVRGCRQVVEDGSNGRLFQPGNSPALIRALRELASSAQLRATWGARSRKRATDQFDESRVVDDVLAVYERLLALQDPNARLRSS